MIDTLSPDYSLARRASEVIFVLTGNKSPRAQARDGGNPMWIAISPGTKSVWPIAESVAVLFEVKIPHLRVEQIPGSGAAARKRDSIFQR